MVTLFASWTSALTTQLLEIKHKRVSFWDIYAGICVYSLRPAQSVHSPWCVFNIYMYAYAPILQGVHKLCTSCKKATDVAGKYHLGAQTEIRFCP